jgi:hypothetical protein
MSRFFLLSLIFIEVNCLYFMTSSYNERDPKPENHTLDLDWFDILINKFSQSFRVNPKRVELEIKTLG